MDFSIWFDAMSLGWFIALLHVHRAHFKIPWLFTNFSLTFHSFSDPVWRPSMAILNHLQFKNYVQTFMLADLIIKWKSQKRNVSDYKLLAIYGKYNFQMPVNYQLFGKILNFLTFFIFSKFPWLKMKFPDLEFFSFSRNFFLTVATMHISRGHN